MKLVIVGTGSTAEIATEYLRRDPEYAARYELVGYALEADKMGDVSTVMGKPVVPIEAVMAELEVGLVLNTVGYDNHLEDRKRVHQKVVELGLEPVTYLSSLAANFSRTIGKGCFIFEANVIQPFVRVGENCILWSGNHIGHHSRIGDHCFISSHVVISGNCRVGDQCFLGVNSCIKDGLKIAPRTVVGMGAVVVRDIEEPGGTWIGSPAERVN